MNFQDARLSELLADGLGTKVQQHRQQEQQQVDALLASQKHLTSNLRTLINSLDTILQLSTPRYSSSQGDLVSSCTHRARGLATKLDQVAARLARIQDHLEQQEAALGLGQPPAGGPAGAAADAAAAAVAGTAAAAGDADANAAAAAVASDNADGRDAEGAAAGSQETETTAEQHTRQLRE